MRLVPPTIHPGLEPFGHRQGFFLLARLACRGTPRATSSFCAMSLPAVPRALDLNGWFVATRPSMRIWQRTRNPRAGHANTLNFAIGSPGYYNVTAVCIRASQGSTDS